MDLKRTTTLVTSGLLSAGLLLGIGLPAQAADPYPALTLSKTAATSTHDLGDSITVSGDGCPVGDAATAYLLDGVFANDATFADIPDADASKATSMSAVLQQISLAMGVAVAGAILEIETTLTGSPLELKDFQIAFMIISALTLLAVLPFLAMAKNAGATVSGHRMETGEEETAAVK